MSYDATEGEITCLLGPSGGGKSTLLRLAAGIESVQSGRVEICGELVASENVFLPPEKRPVGLMFQENALFPHMTVADNVRFGLNGLSKQASESRVADLLELVGLTAYADRYPHALSGGQQQRVALVRSLAPHPKVLLMDEPYASIDITLRRALREAARHTLKLNETTSVMVTHDPPEAMEMADTIAVLDEGKIVQAGSPKVLYEDPSTASVAALFGDAQLITGSCENGGIICDYGRVELHSQIKTRKNLEDISELVVRPHGLELSLDSSSKLRVVDLRFVGENWVAFLLSEDMPASAPALRVQSNGSVNIGDRVSLKANPVGCYIF